MLNVRLTHITTHITTLCALLAALATGCADVSSFDAGISEKNFGEAARTVYSCETATIAPSGHKWLYRTEEIMNLMSQITLSVSRDQDNYGDHVLPRVGTDLFSDGNLTVQLVQRGEIKSIAVDHKNTSLYARAENGWCSSFKSDAYVDYASGDSTSNGSTSNESPWEGSASDGSTSNESPWTTPEDSSNNQNNNNNSNNDQNEITPWGAGPQDFELELARGCQNPCALFVKTSMQISQVVYYADGYEIARSRAADQNFMASYIFYQTGERNITAVGYDHFDQAVAQASASLFVTDDGDFSELETPSANTSGFIDVPYFYQYSNSTNKGNSCQVTSIAMLLNYYRVSVTPDMILYEIDYDVGSAQSPGGLRNLYNRYAQSYGVPEVDLNTEGTIADLKAALDAGKPVITHGWYTRSGHILVVVGYNENGYFVNDPAGTWSQEWKGGYDNARYETEQQGKGVFYEKRAFELATFSHDNRTIDTAWLHIPR